MSFANAAMLIGLLGVAVPLVVHLLSRRRVPTIEWGAMQFLDAGPRDRTRVRLTEWLLLAARMMLVAMAALAAARPLWGGGDGEGGPRDVVLVVDTSASMARQGIDGSTPMDAAMSRARRIVDGLGPADGAAIVRAGARAVAVVEAPTGDRERLSEALDALPDPAGPGDLPAAVGVALRSLERSRKRDRRIIIFTDGQRTTWRADEPGRWRLLRELHRRMEDAPTIEAPTFAVEPDPEAADGAVGAVRPSRRQAAPGATVGVEATVRNAGPGPLERPADLLIDGEPVPGARVAVGPVPAGGEAPVAFRATIDAIGPHVLTVRLAGGDRPDPLPDDDAATAAVEVTAALPVLLIDGEPGREPLTGEVDFLRAALVPIGDEAPQAVATVAGQEAITDEGLAGQRVLVLANVDRLTAGQSEAVAAFLGRGGGVLVAPGDRTDAEAWEAVADRDGRGWLPARIGEAVGRVLDREVVARPDPSTFEGPVLGPFGAATLGEAGLFAYFILGPAAGDRPATVLGRLDTGAPWLVERPYREGRVALLAGPLDAEGGTLPAVADFVPFVHELIAHLADPAPPPAASRPGEPLIVALDPSPSVGGVMVRMPSGLELPTAVDLAADPPTAAIDATDAPGLYRFTWTGPGGAPIVADRLVLADPREADPAPLSADDASAIADGWPLTFADPDASAVGSTAAGPRPIWRFLVLASLLGLCLESWMTRRLARSRGPIAEAAEVPGR